MYKRGDYSMYRVRGSIPRIEEVLNRMEKKKIPPYKPVNYAKNDRAAAKAVLTKLLSCAQKNIVTTIRITPKELEEV